MSDLRGGVKKNSIKVLIVDDDTDSMLLMIEYLKAEGFRPGYARNGREALDWIKNNGDPDAILLDLGMPVMNGKEFMQTYAGSAAIIIATGWDEITVPSDTVEPFGVLHKPLNIWMVKETIERAVQANGGPKWKRLLPCKHSCVSLDIQDDLLVFACLIPGCNKSKAVHKDRLDFQTVLELTISIAQDSAEREERINLS